MKQDLIPTEAKRRRTRSLLLAAGIGILFFSMTFSGGSAQEKYPSRPIHFIIGLPAGSPTDISTRALVAAAGKILGQPIVVLNKPGGATVVAIAGLKNEKPDGYTIGSLSSAAMLSQHMRKVPYEVIKDFIPIIQYGVYHYGLVVRDDSPWKTFPEFIEYSKSNPGKIRYSTIGPGSPQHLVMERLAMREKIKWTAIPFEGGPQSISALLGGHVEASSQAGEGKKHIEAGRLRLLAAYGEQRNSDFPNVPTLRELGIDIVPLSIICILGPKGVSPQVVEILHGAFRKAMEDPDFIKMCRQGDQTPVYRGPQELTKHLMGMDGEMETLIKTLGLRKE